METSALCPGKRPYTYGKQTQAELCRWVGLDIATASWPGNSVSLRLGNGDGKPDLTVPDYERSTVAILFNETPAPPADLRIRGLGSEVGLHQHVGYSDQLAGFEGGLA